MSHREEILEAECDFPTLHTLLAHLPEREDLQVERLIGDADRLMETFSPCVLREVVAVSPLHPLLRREK